MTPKERIDRLKQFLAEDPTDAMALYALGLEHKAAGDPATARDYFSRLLKTVPDHVPGHYQLALVLVQLNRSAAAVRVLRAGIRCAVETGQLHARDKMQELMETLKKKA